MSSLQFLCLQHDHLRSLYLTNWLLLQFLPSSCRYISQPWWLNCSVNTCHASLLWSVAFWRMVQIPFLRYGNGWLLILKTLKDRTTTWKISESLLEPQTLSIYTNCISVRWQTAFCASTSGAVWMLTMICDSRHVNLGMYCVRWFWWHLESKKKLITCCYMWRLSRCN